MNFEAVIGIEIHVEMKTRTKMFSASPNRFGATPNTLVTPVDMAFPGTLPVVNKHFCNNIDISHWRPHFNQIAIQIIKTNYLLSPAMCHKPVHILD